MGDVKHKPHMGAALPQRAVGNGRRRRCATSSAEPREGSPKNKVQLHRAPSHATAGVGVSRLTRATPSARARARKVRSAGHLTQTAYGAHSRAQAITFRYREFMPRLFVSVSTLSAQTVEQPILVSRDRPAPGISSSNSE